MGVWNDTDGAPYVQPLDGAAEAAGLSPRHREVVAALLDEYRRHASRNAILRDYYNGDVTVNDYGISVANNLLRNDQVCHWPEKAVDALAQRVRLDGFRGEGDETPFDAIAERNGIVNAYMRHRFGKLTYGCMFATVNNEGAGLARVRFHTAETATAIAGDDYDSGQVAAGLAVSRASREEYGNGRAVPTQLHVYLPNLVIQLDRTGSAQWRATELPTPSAVPQMVAFAHCATGDRPFGKSRISPFVRKLTDDAVRTMFRMEVAAALYSMPARYALGLTPEQVNQMVNNKARSYLDGMFLGSVNKDGQNTIQYGQLPANSPEPYIAQLRCLAGQLAGATGVPLNSLGIVQDNPSSAEAIQAAREDICLIAEDEIAADRASLRQVARLAMAIERGVSPDSLDAASLAVSPHFKNPMLNSIAAGADAGIKLASSDQSFGGTREFYEMVGYFDEETIDRIMRNHDRARAQLAASAVLGRPLGVVTDAQEADGQPS